MQQLEQNVSRGPFGTLLVAAAVFLASAGIAAPLASSSILHDTPLTACQAGADYVAGVDAQGGAVVPADINAGPVPVPPQVVMKLPNQPGGPSRGYVVLDGAQIAPLINPPPCHD